MAKYLCKIQAVIEAESQEEAESIFFNDVFVQGVSCPEPNISIVRDCEDSCPECGAGTEKIRWAIQPGLPEDGTIAYCGQCTTCETKFVVCYDYAETIVED
jgi:hypothetical protein